MLNLRSSFALINTFWVVYFCGHFNPSRLIVAEDLVEALALALPVEGLGDAFELGVSGAVESDPPVKVFIHGVSILIAVYFLASGANCDDSEACLDLSASIDESVLESGAATTDMTWVGTKHTVVVRALATNLLP